MHEGKPVLNIQLGAMVHRRLIYIYLLNVPSFSSRYFNKIKRTSRLGRLLALSLEILSDQLGHSEVIMIFLQISLNTWFGYSKESSH